MGRGGAASAISRGAALAIFVARLCPTSIRSGAFVYNLCRRHAAGDSIDQRGTPMKQYPLSIYQPDGDPPPPQVLKPIMQDIDTLVQDKRRPAHGSSAGACAPEHGYRAAGPRRPSARDRSMHRGRGARHPVLDRQCARSRRRARVEPQGHPGDHASQSRCGCSGPRRTDSEIEVDGSRAGARRL